MIEETPARTRSPLWTKSFTLLLAGATFQGLSFYFLMPVLPLYVQGPLSGSKSMIGVAVAIFSLTAVTVRAISGTLLDRYGRRVWQLGSAVLFLLAMFAYLLVDSFLMLVLVRLINGLAWGVAGVSSATVASDLVPPRRRGEGMGMYGMAMPLALAAGPMLGMLVLGESRFEHVFLACGGLGMAALACFALVNTPRVHNPEARLEIRKLFEVRVMRISFFMTILCVGYGGVVAFVPLYAPRFGFDGSGPLFLVYAAGVITSRLFGGRWYDRQGPLAPCLTGLVLLVSGWLGLGLVESGWAFLAAGFFLGLGFGLIMPSVQAMTVDLVPSNRRGAANATLFSSFDIGISTGALGFGLLAERVDLSVIFLVSAALAGLAAMVLLFSVNPYYRKNRPVQDAGA
jgi:predicted MFS family arabinose efflux permease